jgi:hypothetical protein
MTMGGGPCLHRRPRGAGTAETTSWAVGGAPHMSPTPLGSGLVGIVVRGAPPAATAGRQQSARAAAVSYTVAAQSIDACMGQ